MNFQKGIFEPAQKHATILSLDLADRAKAGAALENLWEDLNERLHDFYAPQALTVTLGIGLPLFEKLRKRAAAPKGLRLMPGWPRDAFKPRDAQADLSLLICANEQAITYYAERDVLRHLEPAFTRRTRDLAFSLPESRGALGFIDGTGNPKGDARLSVALIGDEEARYAGGSFFVVRKLREDLRQWHKASVDQQERVIGRKLADSAKLDDEPLNSHKNKSTVKDKAGHEIKMLRRSIPYNSPDESGLIFMCYVRDPKQFELTMDRMVSPTTDGKKTGEDAVRAFYTAVSGGYYFVPPVLDDGYLGAFLFE